VLRCDATPKHGRHLRHNPACSGAGTVFGEGGTAFADEKGV
jgi:hypothetical protein